MFTGLNSATLLPRTKKRLVCVTLNGVIDIPGVFAVLYLRGNNPGNLIKYGGTGTVTFESGQIYYAFNGRASYIGTRDQRNLTGFNTLYVNGYCINSGQNTLILCANTSNGSSITDGNSALTEINVTADREYTVSLNISMVNANRYIHFGGFVYGYLYRMWLG